MTFNVRDNFSRLIKTLVRKRCTKVVITSPFIFLHLTQLFLFCNWESLGTLILEEGGKVFETFSQWSKNVVSSHCLPSWFNQDSFISSSPPHGGNLGDCKSPAWVLNQRDKFLFVAQGLSLSCLPSQRVTEVRGSTHTRLHRRLRLSGKRFPLPNLIYGCAGRTKSNWTRPNCCPAAAEGWKTKNEKIIGHCLVFHYSPC